MNDKSLSILLSAAFGIPGLLLLLMAWLRPDMAEGRLIATIVGAAGLLLGVLQMLAFFRASVKRDEEREMIKVTADNRR